MRIHEDCAYIQQMRLQPYSLKNGDLEHIELEMLITINVHIPLSNHRLHFLPRRV